MTPWLQDADVTLYHGDVLTTLQELPAESVDCVVTSPPYWGLRDYGTGQWEGGDAECDHKGPPMRTNAKPYDGSATFHGGHQRADEFFSQTCGKCGATRIDQQLGLEPTPEQYVERMVEVFREVRRVLAAHGTVWLNLGDSYATRSQNNHGKGGDMEHAHLVPESWPGHREIARSHPVLKEKDLVGIPWRVAFALQADGWYLRSDIIWAKPNPMPESVTDRPTKSHEYVFLLSKRPRYFFDQEAVREGFTADPENGGGWSQRYRDEQRKVVGGGDDFGRTYNPAGRNIRSVWDIATQPFPEAHFATFPEELARRCIAAGTSEKGKCPECGAPWVRELERKFYGNLRTADNKDGHADLERGITRNEFVGGKDYHENYEPPKTLAWIPSCKCNATVVTHDCLPVPSVVLDPFMGSGTVAHVARKLGRHAVGIDLSAEYLALAARRLQQQSLFAIAPEG